MASAEMMFFLKRIIHIWCVYDYSFLFFSFPTPMDKERLSMGKGNTMVELCSVEMALRVCKYRSCNADLDSSRTNAASFRWVEAFCSPSAAIT